MSIEALSEALKVLLSLSDSRPAQQLQSPSFEPKMLAKVVSTPTDSPPAMVATLNSSPSLGGTKSVAIVPFRRALEKLYADPPVDYKGNQDGVPGYAVRELCATYKEVCPRHEMVAVLTNEFNIALPTAKFWVGVE